MATTYHCERAWLGGEDAAGDVAITVAGDRIVAIETGVAPTATAVHLRGLTLPGFANAHSHAFHRALRGRTQRQTGSFWTWRQAMYRLAEELDPDRYRRLAEATFAEMAQAGITAVGEFHYLHHQRDGHRYADANLMGRVLVDAAASAGLRITLLDTCYLHGGIGVEAEGVQRRFDDGDAPGWAARVSELADEVDGATARVGAAVHSVRAVDPASIEVVAAWAAAQAVPLHAHVSEQPAENEQCLAAHGRTPVEVLADAGAAGDHVTAVHGTHLTDDDIARLGAAGSGCCLCPTTERDLADGIGPARRLAEAGVRLCLGSDSHAVIDLLEEARAVELDERLATGRRGHHAPDALLRMATAAGHAAIGWPDAGQLAVGALADLVSIADDSVRTAGLEVDPLGTAVYAAAAADVHHVVVGGRVVVDGGRHVSIDVPAALRRSIEEVWP